MLKSWLAVSAIALVLTGTNAQAQKRKPAAAGAPKSASKKMSKPSTDAQKAGYTIGVDLGRNLKQQKINIDVEQLAAGLNSAYNGGTLALSDEEMKTAMSSLQASVATQAESKNKTVSDKNSKEGAAFMEANAKKEGVKTLPNGMQYLVLKEGTGPRPSDTSKVTTHYHGTLIDGTVFDSSVDRGQPATFPVNGVIKGWQVALPMMPTGSKWRLFIPSDLAYGARGAGEKIGPNATLIFEVELLKIEN